MTTTRWCGIWTAGRGSTLDFLGFGLSDKPRPHRYSLLEQADIVAAVVAEAASGPMVLIAHDMGTSVATELLARDLQGRLPFELQRAVIGNGSVILNRASLRPAQKLLRGPLGPILSRLSSESSFVRGFGRLFSADHPLTEEEGRAQWALWSATTTGTASRTCSSRTWTNGSAMRRDGTAPSGTGPSR